MFQNPAANTATMTAVPQPAATWAAGAATTGAPWNRMAIVSVFLAVPGLWLGVFLVPQVFAIILGAMAHQRAATSGQRGRRLAIAGMIIGGVELALWILLLVALIVAPVGPGPGTAVMG